jgi:hypothetical protein
VIKKMKAFAVACLAVAASAVTLERADCPFCAGVDAPKVFIDSSSLDGVGLAWANSVLQTPNIATMERKNFFAAGSNVIPNSFVNRIGASEYDQKLLTEGWKIGQSADTFLPSEMNVGSVIRAAHLGNAPRVGASEYDQKLLTEGWKIGQSADTFLPSEMNVGSVIRAATNVPGTSHMPVGASEYDQKLLTEGWKIGQSADTFLPANMDIHALRRAYAVTHPSKMSEYDNKILTEGFKLGASSDTFLPREQSFIRSPLA